MNNTKRNAPVLITFGDHTISYGRFLQVLFTEEQLRWNTPEDTEDEARAILERWEDAGEPGLTEALQKGNR